MKTYELIIFDMDGTIVDSRHFHATVFEKFLELYWRPVSYNKCYEVVGTTVKNVFESVGVPDSDHVKFFQLLSKYYYDNAVNHLAQSHLIDGVKELLIFLKQEKQVRLALVSNSLNIIVEMFILYHELTDIFDDIIGANPKSTNKNDRCCKLKEKYGFEPNKILAVGDAESDIVLANELGFDSCFAKTNVGWYKNVSYIEEHLCPTYTITSYQECLDKLRGE